MRGCFAVFLMKMLDTASANRGVNSCRRKGAKNSAKSAPPGCGGCQRGGIHGQTSTGGGRKAGRDGNPVRSQFTVWGGTLIAGIDDGWDSGI